MRGLKVRPHQMQCLAIAACGGVIFVDTDAKSSPISKELIIAKLYNLSAPKARI